MSSFIFLGDASWAWLTGYIAHRNGPFGGVVAFQVKKKEEKRGKEFIA